MKTLNKNYIMVGMFLGAMVVAGGAVAGVADSKHNLGSTNSTGTNKVTGGTNEVCVFCHTPHGSNTDAKVPLWNKTLPDSASFTTYDSLGTSSLDGNITAVGSVSIACLSCHDGSQAMDVMVNTPGSGNATMSGSWSGSTVVAGAVGTGGTMTVDGANFFPMLGTDLQNDHPIGIQYAGGGIDNSTALKKEPADETALNDEDFVVPAYKTVNGIDVWYLDVDEDGKRQKTDLPLYTRTAALGDGFAGVPEPFVECASCHDPHESVNATFLRINNAGSAVCLACHDK
jgi:predicted CXXCH cytochrome family protein